MSKIVDGIVNVFKRLSGEYRRNEKSMLQRSLMMDELKKCKAELRSCKASLASWQRSKSRADQEIEDLNNRLNDAMKVNQSIAEVEKKYRDDSSSAILAKIVEAAGPPDNGGVYDIVEHIANMRQRLINS